MVSIFTGSVLSMDEGGIVMYSGVHSDLISSCLELLNGGGVFILFADGFAVCCIVHTAQLVGLDQFKSGLGWRQGVKHGIYTLSTAGKF